MAIANFGAFAGGLAQGIGRGLDMQKQQALLKLRMEQAKQEAEFNKLKIDQLKQAEKERKRQEDAKEQLGVLLSGNQRMAQPSTAQPGLEAGSPRGSGVIGQEPYTASPQELLAVAGQAGMTPAQQLQLGISSGMISTPKAMIDMLKFQLDMQKENRSAIMDHARLKNMRSQIEARQLGMQKTQLDMTETRGKIRIRAEGERMKNGFIEKVQALANAGDMNARRSLEFIAVGDTNSAVDALYRPYAGMSEIEIANRAMSGDINAIETLGLKTELKGQGKDFTLTMGDNGIESITYGIGGQDKVMKRKEAEQYLQDMSGLDYTKALVERTREIVLSAGGQNIVGPAGVLSQLGSSLNALRQGYTQAKGDLAAKYERDAFSERAEASTRVHSMLTILAALATRDILGETGVLTNQDIKRGERVVGASSRLFSGPNTNENILIRLDELDKTLSLRESSILKRQKRAADFFTPGRVSKSMPFLEKAMEKAGMISPQTNQPPTKSATEQMQEQIKQMTPEQQRERLRVLNEKKAGGQ